MRDAQGASEAHDLDEGGANPSPATGGFAELVKLERWMRERGIRRAKLGELELELGELPTTPAPEREVSPEEEQRKARAALRRELDTVYAHVGGFQGTDDEIDRRLGYR